MGSSFRVVKAGDAGIGSFTVGGTPAPAKPGLPLRPGGGLAGGSVLAVLRLLAATRQTLSRKGAA